MEAPQAVPHDVDTRRAELWELMSRLLDRAEAAGTVRADLALSDVHLAVLAVRAVIDETAARAPDAWRRHLAVVLAGFRPAAAPLAEPPADDSLVARRIAPHC